MLVGEEAAAASPCLPEYAAGGHCLNAVAGEFRDLARAPPTPPEPTTPPNVPRETPPATRPQYREKLCPSFTMHSIRNGAPAWVTAIPRSSAGMNASGVSTRAAATPRPSATLA